MKWKYSQIKPVEYSQAEFQIIQALFLFPTVLTQMICEYSYHYNSEFKWDRGLASNIHTRIIDTPAFEKHFKSDYMFLFIMFKLSLDALRESQHFDCETWNLYYGTGKNPIIKAYSNAVYMLELCLIGDVVGKAHIGMIEFISQDPNKRNSKENWSDLKNCVRASVSLTPLIPTKISQALMEFVHDENKKINYVIPQLVNEPHSQKKNKADLAINFFLDSKDTLTRNRCMDFARGGGYLFILSANEFKTLDSASTQYDQLSEMGAFLFDELKVEIEKLLTNYRYDCEKEIESFFSLGSTKEKAARSRVTASRIKKLVEESISLSGLEASMQYYLNDPNLFNFVPTSIKIQKLISNVKQSKLPSKLIRAISRSENEPLIQKDSSWTLS